MEILAAIFLVIAYLFNVEKKYTGKTYRIEHPEQKEKDEC